ncbi:ABC transporter [Aliihoeflea sp. 40Bstr573]|nr:ABC-type transport auxiliary lipoprotein family protein [Aliihoeflea sp. 40Bstr573]MCO6385586.1 ABC transporter [Aliihoeflea sp. 40Bstr573]
MRFRILAVAGLAFSLSGCALLGGGPAPLDTFELTTTATVAAGPQRGRTQILIAEPTALQSLDGQEIVIRTSPGSIEYLSGAQWSDRLPRVVQVRLAEAFQASGRLAGVGLPGQGLAIDYQIVTEVRTFGVRVDGGARADVGLFVKVLNDRNGSVRASRLFTAQAPVSGAGNVAYAAALDQAFSQAISELVPWALSAM